MSYHGHILMENRHGFVVNAKATLSTGKAERQAAVDLVAEMGRHPPDDYWRRQGL